ncbi:GatB/YqeY domain-containing protein [Pelagibacteraceae bacterium]|nr:GatB/YqeY domain-containing protein [Pelagibacteraceae bacterium]
MIKVTLKKIMSLKTLIEKKLNQALKDKDKNTYPTLRLVVSAIKDAEIANRTKEKKDMSDSDIMIILKKMIKQRNESCEVYKKAGRHELLELESKEIEVINVFLPKQLNDEETKKICSDTIKETGATSMKDMGKIMNILKSKYSDTLDFAKVSSVIKELLN